MAKKFEKDDGRNLNEKIETIIMNDNTRESLISFDNNPNAKNMGIIKNILDSDDLINFDDKKEIIKWLEKKYFIFFWDKTPEDYYSLKDEAIFFRDLTEKSFYLMAHRLKIIRDNQLYKEDGYSDFKSFIENEIKIERSTAYKYINVIEVFGVEPVQHDIEYSKIGVSVGLLKDKNINEEDRKEIKEYVLKEAQISTKKQMIEKVKDLREKYINKNNIIIENKEDNDFYYKNLYNNVLTKNKKINTKAEKDYILKLIEYLQELL